MLCLAGISLIYEEGPLPLLQALDGVDLEVVKGERLGLCGPSGAGKSSLLLAAAGLIEVSSGRVVMDPHVRTGLVLQEPENALFANTVADELHFAPRSLGLNTSGTEAAINEALAVLGLPTSVLGLDPLALPPSQRRLVALAAVLTGHPDLLLLDEPTVGLNACERGRLIGMIRDYAGTILVASHDMDMLWRACDRVALLVGGHLSFCGDWNRAVEEAPLFVRAGIKMPVPLAALASLHERGWRSCDPGHDEASVARAIMDYGPVSA